MRDTNELLAVRVLKEPGAETTSTVGTAVDLGADSPNSRNPMATINVGTVSGTSPTLDVLVEGSDDGTTWATAGTFAQKTAAGKQALPITPFRQYRYNSTIAGTSPSFDYYVEVLGHAAAHPAATLFA